MENGHAVLTSVEGRDGQEFELVLIVGVSSDEEASRRFEEMLNTRQEGEAEAICAPANNSWLVRITQHTPVYFRLVPVPSA